jgi:hypothetical protein
MSGGNIDRLVAMANQIAQFFASQPHATGAAGVADHLKAFWTPRMRETLIAWTKDGGQDLHPLARKAVGLLDTAPAGAVRATLAHAGQPTARAPGDDAG